MYLLSCSNAIQIIEAFVHDLTPICDIKYNGTKQIFKMKKYKQAFKTCIFYLP